MSGHVSEGQLSALIDGELSLTSREAVRAHLSGCPECAARHDAMVDVVATLRGQPALEWRPATRESVLARLDAPRRRPRRHRSLAVAGAIAVLAAILLAAQTAAVGAAMGFVAAGIGVLAAVLPGRLVGLPVLPVAWLLAAAILGTTLAYPMARRR